MSLEQLRDQLAPCFADLFPSLTVEHGRYLVARLAGTGIVPVLSLLRDNWGFTMLSDLTCIDYPDRAPRFEMNYNLYAIGTGARILLKVGLPAEAPEIDSAVPVFASANWYEREVWDLFGVAFRGHPNLRRMFLYESFVGHPLRKDYPIGRRQPQIGPTDYIKPLAVDGGESFGKKDRLVVKRTVR